MDETAGAETPRDVLRHVAAIRRRVRADRRAVSGPLLVLGLVALCGALLQLQDTLRSMHAAQAAGPDELIAVSEYSPFYWSLAVPLGFAALTVMERWQWRQRGVSGGGRQYGWIAAAGVAALFVPFAWLTVELGGPFLLIGGGLGLAGVLQRHRPLTVVGVVVGLVGTAEGFYWISNRLPASVWESWWHDAIYLAVAALMIVAGLIALRLERATR
jgi:hypothetical protein